MLYLALVAGSFAIGVILGRWWTLAAAVGLGMRVGVGEDVEVSGWYLGLGYAVLAGLAIAVGVLVRRRLANRGG